MTLKIFLLLLLFTASLSVNAAFNKVEQEQLAHINEQYQRESSELSTRIDNLHQKSLEYFPEQSKQIESLINSWLSMIEHKCRLESFESQGTDAELSVFEACSILEKEKIAKYLENMVAMP